MRHLGTNYIKNESDSKYIIEFVLSDIFSTPPPPSPSTAPKMVARIGFDDIDQALVFASELLVDLQDEKAGRE